MRFIKIHRLSLQILIIKKKKNNWIVQTRFDKQTNNSCSHTPQNEKPNIKKQRVVCRLLC